MSANYATEIVRRVFDNDEGAAVTIGPSGDFPGNVRLHTEPQYQEYFGKVDIDLPAAMMRKIGEALIACAAEEEGKE
jgi:hypothetical protein